MICDFFLVPFSIKNKHISDKMSAEQHPKVDF